MDHQVAILGGGITGCVAAALLTDAGVRVAILERAPDLMMGASLWNDGKIHLGFTFTGTDSLATAALMQEGAATFRAPVEQVIGGALHDLWVGAPVTYLVDTASMLDPDTLWSRAQRVAFHLQENGDRMSRTLRAPGPVLRRLDPDDAGRLTGQDRIAAAWRTSEIHLSPGALADAIRGGIHGRGIPVLRHDVRSVTAIADGWRIGTADGSAVTAASVINCLWQERPRIDGQVTGRREPVSIRFKWCLFGRGVSSIGQPAPSTRILGRYGDIVWHPDGDAYLSWYPAGLAARSDDGVPPMVPEADRETVVAATLAGLGFDRSILGNDETLWTVGGGHIVAHGRGDIDTLDSPLHRRDRPDALELREGFVSVDTGKYTLGPLMAGRAADLVLRRLRGSTSHQARRPNTAPITSPIGEAPPG